jgi:DNA-binding response OmpR family regulator
MAQILLVADRKTTIDSLLEILGRREHRLTVASNQRRVLQLVRQLGPDLVMVDQTSSQLSGEKICQVVRQQTEAPIIAILREAPSGDQTLPDIDDWLVKPFSAGHLLGLVSGIAKQPRELQVGPFALDLRTRQLRVAGGAMTRLTPKQFALLRCFLSRPGEVWSRAALMEAVWQTSFLDDTRTLDVHVRWLREQIEPDPGEPLYLQTVRGVGYRFVAPVEVEVGAGILVG